MSSYGGGRSALVVDPLYSDPWTADPSAVATAEGDEFKPVADLQSSNVVLNPVICSVVGNAFQDFPEFQCSVRNDDDAHSQLVSDGESPVSASQSELSVCHIQVSTC